MAFSEVLFPTDQDPCGAIEFGEVEDYCINIIRDDNTCPPVDTVLFDAINFTGAFMYWHQAEGAIAYTYRYREVGTLEYSEFATVDTFAPIEELTKCTTYEVQIRTVCLEDTTSYGIIYSLVTDCDVAVEDLSELLSNFEVFPNPTTDYTDIRVDSKSPGEHALSIFSTQGILLHSRKLYINQNQSTHIRLGEIAQYPPGLYFIVIEKDGVRATKKLVKM